MSIKIYYNGSASLFVLITISVISLCFISSFYNVMRLQDIVRMRESYANRVYLAEGVLNCAIAFVYQHYDAVKTYAKTPAQKIEIYFDDLRPAPEAEPSFRKKMTLSFGWVTPPNVSLVGRATIVMQEGVVLIDAVISRGKKELAVLTCQVVKPHNSSDLIVFGWRHDQAIGRKPQGQVVSANALLN